MIPSNLQNFFEVVIPILLFYTMRTLDRFIVLDKYIGPNHVAAQVGEYFIYGVVGILISNLLYPLVQKIAIKNKNTARLVFQVLNYPVDYFWNSIILIGLLAENLNPIVRTPTFTFAVISLSSWLQIPVRKFIEIKYEDVRQEVFQNGVIRDVSLFVIVFIACLLSVTR